MERSELISRDPRDGSEIGRVPMDDESSVRAKVARAGEAFRSWAEAPWRERAGRLRRIRAELQRRGHELAELVSREMGKPLAESYFVEVIPNKDIFNYHLRQVPRLLKPRRVRLDPLNYPRKRGTLQLVPRGVVALITPWNFPAAISLRSIVPVLLTGNTLVYKPSSSTALTGAFLAEVFQAHLPPGVFEIVQGPGALGEKLLDCGIDMLLFTGSLEVGRHLAARAGERLIPVSLELGGKGPAIVLPDADLDRAAAGLVWGAFNNCGQNCASIERVIAISSIHDELIERLEREMKRLRLWSQEHGDGDVGVFATQAQRQIAAGQVAQAVRDGARLIRGGEFIGEQGYSPALLADVTPEMPVVREETFGPVLPVLRAESADEAVHLANECAYGLTASIWTRDFALARRMARRIECGVVTVNNHSFTAAIPAAPWTGVKGTGYGCTNSVHAIQELLRPRFYLEDHAGYPRENWWYPYDERALSLARAVLDVFSPGVAGSIRALPRLVRALRRRFS